MNLIPRLEWNDQIVSATRTATDPVLASIASTTNISVGMIASGTGIPIGATVISKTVNSVTLSVAASLSGTSNVTFFKRFDFQYPPIDDTEEVLKPKNNVSTSLTGKQQVSTLHVEATRGLEFGFVNSTDADILKNDFYAFALYGNEFRYFPDQDETPFVNYEMERYEYKRDRQIKKHPAFLYKMSFLFRRVYI